MSVTKSVVSCVAGILVGRGVLDPEAPISTYVPEVAGSGYDGATVRHLLDMRTGVAFRETYLEPDAEVRVMERSMGWRPADEGDPAGMYEYMTTLGTSGPHGGDFTYRSADTDMLGWVVERASDTRMADLITSLVWAPIGAEHDAHITCDPVGSAIHDGGLSATARDLARFGQMLLDDGFVDGVEVVPAAWLADARHPSPAVRQAFANTDNEEVLTGGWYRNQFWFVPGAGRRGAGVPGHPRPDGLREPRHPHRRREAVVLARCAEQQLPDRHTPGLRCHRRRAEQHARRARVT